MGVHRAVRADRRVRPVSRAAAAAVRGRDLAVQDWRAVAGDTDGVRRLVTVHNRFRQWRDDGVFEALLEGLIAEAAKRGEVDLSLVTIDSTTARSPRRRRNAPGSRRPHSSLPWRRPRPRRRRPGQKGRLRRTKRAGSRSRPRAGGGTTHLAPTRTPPEGRHPGVPATGSTPLGDGAVVTAHIRGVPAAVRSPARPQEPCATPMVSQNEHRCSAETWSSSIRALLPPARSDSVNPLPLW